MKVSFFGVLGAEPLGEGVAEYGFPAGARGRLSPPFVHFKRSFWVALFYSTCPCLCYTKTTNLHQARLKNLLHRKKSTQYRIFLISLKYDLWLHSGKYGQADCGKPAV